METVQVSKELMLEMIDKIKYYSNHNLMGKIESELPELFKQKFEVGKWYKFGNRIFRLSKIEKHSIHYDNHFSYGDCNLYVVREQDHFSYDSDTYEKSIPATPQEIENHLNKLRISKGFVKGVKVKRNWLGCLPVGVIENEKVIYRDHVDQLTVGERDIYKAGQWATIIEEKVSSLILDECVEKIKSCSSDKRDSVIEAIAEVIKRELR